jgi:hypothetical protein
VATRRRMALMMGAPLACLLVAGNASASVPHSPALSHVTLQRPTRQEISLHLRTWWIDPKTHSKFAISYLLSRDLYTVSDGRGGALTVVSGFACCGDGTGQGVFFWHNRSFIGMGSRYVPDPVKEITSTRPGVIVVVFYGYTKSDARCCPTGSPVRAVFRWNGRRLVWS